MFLLHCSDDDSLVICNKSNVIFQNEVEKGDVVSFHYREKEYLGTIIECSENEKELQDLRKKMCIQKKKLKQHAGTSSQQLIDTKRNDIQNRKYKDCPSIFKCNTNNEENTNKKIKKLSKCDKASNAKNTQLSELLHEDSTFTDELFSNTSSDEYEYEFISQTQKKKIRKEYGKLENNYNSSKAEICNGNPKRQDLQKKLEEALATIADLKKRIGRTENNAQNVNSYKKNEEPQDSDSKGDIRHLEQLYGKNWSDDTMVLLRDEIYCRESILREALGASSKASHLVRRLLLGIFKKDTIYHITLTGRSPRAAGRVQNASERLFPLDEKAKIAIIKYSQSIAKKKGWIKQSSKSLLLVMTQRIGEIKRDIKSEQQSK